MKEIKITELFQIILFAIGVAIVVSFIRAGLSEMLNIKLPHFTAPVTAAAVAVFVVSRKKKKFKTRKL